VLAGYLAGALAQPLLRADLGLVVRQAVWAHGHAADVLSDRQGVWMMMDLVDALGNTARVGFT